MAGPGQCAGTVCNCCSSPHLGSHLATKAHSFLQWLAIVNSYYSQTLSRSQKQYCVTRQELLAVIKAVQHFHHYLYGRHFMDKDSIGLIASRMWKIGAKLVICVHLAEAQQESKEHLCINIMLEHPPKELHLMPLPTSESDNMCCWSLITKRPEKYCQIKKLWQWPKFWWKNTSAASVFP